MKGAFRRAIAGVSLVAFGCGIGFWAGARSQVRAAQVLGPAEGWTLHSDVDHHFPRHPRAFAHHWCKVVTPRLTECQLYDGDGPNAKLIGVEPIVSDQVYRTFKASERPYWHWHKTSRSRIVIPGATAQRNAQANAERSTSHGKTVLLWDPQVTLDPLGLPRIIPH